MLQGLRFFERSIKSLNSGRICQHPAITDKFCYSYQLQGSSELNLITGSSSSALQSKEAFSWGPVDNKAFANCLLVLCEMLRPILSSEDRLLTLRLDFRDVVGYSRFVGHCPLLLSVSQFL